jgi:hypothetical protein
MFTNFFNRQGRTLLMLAAVLVVGTVCLSGCGGDKGLLAGTWVNVDDDEEGLVFFKDGTGAKEGVNFTWKIENKRLFIIAAGMPPVSLEYKVSRDELDLDGDKYKRAEVQQGREEAFNVLVSYESAVLAAAAEKGNNNFTKKDVIINLPKDGAFVYTISEDAMSCTATAKKDIGNFKKGGTITSQYDKTNDAFVHNSSRLDEARRLKPNFFANQPAANAHTPAPSNQQVTGGGELSVEAKLIKRIPADYKLYGDMIAHGDLNADSTDDYALVIAKKDGDREYAVGIMIFFKDGNDYKLALENRQCLDGMAEDPTEIKITKGNLYLKLWQGGKLAESSYTFTFRYRNSDFELIGQDYMDRDGGDISVRSINFLSKKKMEKGIDGKETWSKISTAGPILLRKLVSLDSWE